MALTCVFCATACQSLRFHRDTNAPGVAEIETPPRRDAGSESDRLPEPETPADPGEHVVAVTPGLYGGGGGRFGRPPGERGAGEIGLEVSVNRGANRFSHSRDAFFVYPVEGYGASLGWTFLQGGGGEVDTGPVFFEVHRFAMFMGAAIGYAVDVGDRDHGPQASLWVGPFQLRTRYFVDGGFEIFFGGQLKLPLVWTTSR